MDLFSIDWKFWLVALGATLIKVTSSPFYSFTRAVLTIFAALFAVYVFTDPIIHYLRLEYSLRLAVAALLALTGEGLMRMIIAWSNDPKQLMDILTRLWRGSSK